jgi:DNA-binding response OmpR family regulator
MEILKILLKQKENPVTRDVFIAFLSNKKLSANKTRTIDMQISNIRKKLTLLNINVNIVSIRGIGYKISEI